MLTKTDLAPPETIDELQRQLRALNPGAARYVVTNGEIVPEALFGAALFDPSHKTVDVRRWINEDAYGTDRHDQGDHKHRDHHHDVHAFCICSDRPLSWEAFSTWLARLRRSAGDDLLRVKGILDLIGESAPVAIHGVHHIFHPPVLLNAWPDSDHRSRIVFIARGIERAELEASFLEHVAAVRA
ncbi:MAG: GTP-binding protein [Bradyrhizobium sp.]|nr:GTP-binding protein [Bradyrhizobium sp.]